MWWATQADTAGGIAATARKEAAEEIKAMETALAALPSSQEQVKASLTESIRMKKKEIVAFRPIGARVDACREWVTRCASRQSQAKEAVALANVALATADSEVAAAAADLSALEDEIAREGRTEASEDATMADAEAEIISLCGSARFCSAEVSTAGHACFRCPCTGRADHER